MVKIVCSLLMTGMQDRKLIGARYYKRCLSSVVGPLNSTFQSPRDDDGHGTHTLSTTAGNFIPGANVLGYANGTAKGDAPKARGEAYKVYWQYKNDDECFGADILAALEQPIFDGMDVLSASIGGDAAEPFHQYGTAFESINHGTVV